MENTTERTVGRSTLICGCLSAIAGAVYVAQDVWSSGFEPDFPAHAQTTADNLSFFAGVGALLFGVLGVVVGFVVGLVMNYLAHRREANEAATQRRSQAPSGEKKHG